jgi:hypothetical protein
LKRAYAKRHDSHKPAPTQPAVPIGATDREIQLSLDRDELLGLMQDSLESLCWFSVNGKNDLARQASR